ncbi:signal recognition particle-docking protein FtsY [Companilactobacillus sp.]|uniref:signal recognition particle-docking protein FtsY n=1 Tax=Companilactobacillus sp. TaxID=2767905 RepID=UPI0026031F4C|nr:signal recognition particle-docking protein FtsY [Companilactobacillus sp.]
MGLFDRIKNAFSGNNEEADKEKETEKSTQETDQQSSESTDTDHATSTEKSEEKPAEKNKSAETITPEDKQSNETVDETESEETKSPEQCTADVNEPQTHNSAVVSDNHEPQEQAENSKLAESEETKSENAESKPAESENDSEPADKVESEPERPVNEESSTADENTNGDEESAENVETDESSEETEDEQEVKEYDEGLKKSRNSFSARFNRFLANFRSVDEDFFDDLEELLIESDVGYETAMRISDELREEVKLRNAKKRSDVSDVIVEKLVDMYDEEGKEEDNALHFSADKTPTVFLFVGVNGAGKTTTIGKLAHRFQSQGKKVLLAAGDTFRAGAIEQLQRWGERVNVPVEAKPAQTDPASVVYDAVQRAINEDFDILLVDTAGRLQNNQNLMRELEKIKRVITRELPEAPQEVLLVLDGSTGQNALSQAKQFNETTNVTAIVLTKIDGSSQGGIVLAIRNELHLPVKLVGLGEQMDDLRDFDPEKFIYGLFKELIVGSGE